MSSTMAVPLVAQWSKMYCTISWTLNDRHGRQAHLSKWVLWLLQSLIYLNNKGSSTEVSHVPTIRQHYRKHCTRITMTPSHKRNLVTGMELVKHEANLGCQSLLESLFCHMLIFTDCWIICTFQDLCFWLPVPFVTLLILSC